MGIRAQIEKKIENKRQEIAGFVELIRDHEAFIAGLQEALKLLPKDRMEERNPDQILRAGSDMAKVRDLLNERGEALYINEILKGIGKEVNKKNRISIGGSLANYVRRGEIFTRPAPNTYGLSVFEIEVESEPNEQSQSENTEQEPPDGFGAPRPVSEDDIPV
ncbi:MAG TPA: hypothetical protein VK747_03965 [Blastocatellia bacterium]|nr:hypothetical protein [Blastocatellia bacterium]